MKTRFIILGLIAIMLLPGSPARAAEASDFPLEGTWRWTFTMPDGSATRPKLKLKTENGQIIGTTSFRPGSETPITNASLQGDKFSFQVVRQREGRDVVTTYSGLWTSNTIKGRIESNWAGDRQSYDWEALRAHFGVEGVWRWTNTFFAFGGFGGRGGAGGGGRSTDSARPTDAGEGSDNASRTNRPPDARSGRGAFGGGGGRGGRGGGRGGGFDSRIEIEQNGEKITGKTVARFGRPSISITNGVYTNGFVYFEIERAFGESRTLTKHFGQHTGDLIKGTMEQEVEGEDREIAWEATRVD